MRDPAKLVARKPGTDMEQAVPESGTGAAAGPSIQRARLERIDEV